MAMTRAEALEFVKNEWVCLRHGQFMEIREVAGVPTYYCVGCRIAQLQEAMTVIRETEGQK